MNGEVIAKEYYENNRKRLQKQAQNWYIDLSEEEKDKKREYRRNSKGICLKKINKNLKYKKNLSQHKENGIMKN